MRSLHEFTNSHMKNCKFGLHFLRVQFFSWILAIWVVYKSLKSLKKFKMVFALLVKSLKLFSPHSSNCTDGYLKIYLKGQETMDAYDKYDHEFCGTEKPYAVISEGPRLVMVFSSGELQGRGFKVCQQNMTTTWIDNLSRSTSNRENIPSKLSTKYLERQHQMARAASRIEAHRRRKANLTHHDILPTIHPTRTVLSFSLQRLTNKLRLYSITLKSKRTMRTQQVAPMGELTTTRCGLAVWIIQINLLRRTSVCSEDWLEMYVIYRDGTDRFLGRYCGFTAPGPVESPRGAVGIRVVLHTDQENVASGFKARYIFEVAKSVFGDCGENFTGLDSGIITSPGYPSNYEGPGKALASKACNWYITARTGYKIFLNFELFGVEGDPASKLRKGLRQKWRLKRSLQVADVQRQRFDFGSCPTPICRR